jgi:hypothetical protein
MRLSRKRGMMKSVCLVMRLLRSRIRLMMKSPRKAVAVIRAVMMRVTAAAHKRCLRKGTKKAKIND